MSGTQDGLQGNDGVAADNAALDVGQNFSPAADHTGGPPPTPTAAPPATPTAAPAAPALPPAEADKAEMLSIFEEKFGDAEPKAPPEAKTPEAPKDGGAAAEAPKEDEDAATGEAAKIEKAGDDDAGDDADLALTEEERAGVPAKVARKVSRLLRERTRLKPDAEAYRNITRYMAESQITGEDAAKGFEVMALIRKDDPRALEILRPYLQRLGYATGQILPPDLQDRVDQGLVDDETAREVALLRTKTERIEAQAREEQTLVSEHRAVQQRNQISTALNQWEVRQAANPDYAAVKDAVFDYAQASFAAKPPATPREAVERIEGFYNTLRRRTPDSVSRPVGRTHAGPPSARSSVGLTAREPQSLAEQIELSLQRFGAA